MLCSLSLITMSDVLFTYSESSRTSLSPSLDSGTFQGGDFIAEPYDRTQDYLPLTKTVFNFLSLI